MSGKRVEVMELERLAVLMDGAYVIKRLDPMGRSFPRAETVRGLASRIASSERGHRLYRVFFYHADPYSEAQRHPLTREWIQFGDTATARNNDRLLRELEEAVNFAVRRGEVAFRGWRVRRAVGRALAGNSGDDLGAEDFLPNLTQKGVDMRIGLDIAALALKRLADTVLLVTGDADMIPAMKFARREGMRVGLCTLGFDGIRRELRAHTDFLVDWRPEPATA